jgi:hypothetical protein
MNVRFDSKRTSDWSLNDLYPNSHLPLSTLV